MQPLCINNHSIFLNTCQAPSQQEFFTEQRVKLFPQISTAALKAHLNKEIIFWYYLRAVNVSGSGKVDFSVAEGLLGKVYSRATFYRIFKAGKGKFWGLTPGPRGDRILIFGAEAVAKFFGITYLSLPKEIPLPEFSINAKAWLYASLFPGQGKKKLKPISRHSIQEATGIKKRTQIRLEKAIKVRKYPNFAVVENGHGTEPLWEVIQGKYLKQRRLGNSYRTTAQQGERSLVKKVNKKLDGGLSNRGGLHPKRFFETPRACHKAGQQGLRHEEAFIRVKRNGKPEWVLVC